jgi:methyl-accepting chemotaxis protein
MSNAQLRLKGKVWWLTWPSTAATAPVALAALFYGAKAFELPAGSGVPLCVFAVGAFVALFPLTSFFCGRSLSTLEEVGAGRAAASRIHLRKVAQEVTALPDRLLRVLAFSWIGGVSSVVWVTHAFARVFPLGLAFRLAASVLMFAPLAVLTAYLVVSLRGRQLLALLIELGLPTAEMIEAIPPRRQQLRPRLLVFSAVLLLSPFAVTADVAVSTLVRGLARVRQAQNTAAFEALADQAVRDTVTSVAVLGGLMVALGLFAAHLGGLSIGLPLRALANQAGRLATGDLREEQVIPGEDELWAVSVAFSQMQQQITRVLAELQRAGMRISSTTEELLATTSKGETGATEQAASVHETTATTEELARVARQIAANADTVAKTAEKTLSAARGGQSNSKAFIDSMTRMRHENNAMSEAVKTLNQRMQQIVRIVEFINGVADKADLLALNAELEGTKAGDVGRGFSLVATEMRRLAENVIKSTREIEQLIDEIRGATAAAVAATEAGVRATDSGATLAEQVSGQLERILTLASDTSLSATAISQATQQQQTSSGQLAEAMTRVLEVTDQNVSSTKQVATSSSDLASLARELKVVVERFRLS